MLSIPLQTTRDSFACLANDYVDLPLVFPTQATQLRLILIPWGGVLGNGFDKETSNDPRTTLMTNKLRTLRKDGYHPVLLFELDSHLVESSHDRKGVLESTLYPNLLMAASLTDSRSRNVDAIQAYVHYAHGFGKLCLWITVLTSKRLHKYSLPSENIGHAR
ncbi:hypothetical protein I7I51_07870 [Histoplasma capsulatum]|uniref:Uncharacterized protein n=1 Tax=Ajellomyces capsulatus TaxID=5037 RepID=A0A8A1M1A2_AJECA|nr:predicted protein [Histoplasma mississippiense (nom. inval.)]EDN02847.1 predicted protein [Histoplasma mississippiense (nom. inval.)]QSS58444.1 hypothetical protein I7I51_07870 [Histoplasma capsulatum]